MLLPRRAQVHVRVDEAREEMPALAVEHLGAVGRRQRPGIAELGDLSPAHQHVERRVEALTGVEHVRPAHEQVGGRLLAVDERLGRARCAGGVHAVTMVGSAASAPRGAWRPVSSS